MMNRCLATLMAGLLAATTAPHAPAADPFSTVACTGIFRDDDTLTPLTVLYRLGRRETQVWDDGARTWRRSGCVKNGNCTIDARHVDVNDGYLSQGRGHLRHRLDIDLSTGRLSEFWAVRDELIQFDARCRPGSDPAPGSEGVAPHYRDESQVTEYSLPDGYPFPMARDRFEGRFPAP